MDVRVLYNVEGSVRAKKMAYPAVFISGRNGDPGEKKEGGQCRVAFFQRDGYPARGPRQRQKLRFVH